MILQKGIKFQTKKLQVSAVQALVVLAPVLLPVLALVSVAEEQGAVRKIHILILNG